MADVLCLYPGFLKPDKKKTNKKRERERETKNHVHEEIMYLSFVQNLLQLSCFYMQNHVHSANPALMYTFLSWKCVGRRDGGWA